MTCTQLPVSGTDRDTDLPQGDGATAPNEALSTTPRRAEEGFPLAGMTLLCLASALLGIAVDHRFLMPAPPEPRIAFAEQGAVVLESLLGHPNFGEAAARRLVGQSLSDVIEQYHRAGYLVLDVTRSADGQILVEAVPQSAVDITPQMRAAVAQAIDRAASAVGGPAPASTAVAGVAGPANRTEVFGSQR